MQILAHNLLSQFTNRQLNITSKEKGKNCEKLSSGYRINRSADDAAGLSISEKMRWQIRGLKKCDKNIVDGISLLQTADGGLDEIASMLHRMKELAVQGLNDTNSDEDVAAIQKELDVLVDEIDSTAERTRFNEIPLLQGDFEKVTEKTITTTTEAQTIKMRYTENSIMPSWVKINGTSPANLSGGTAGKMIKGNPNVSSNTVQNTKLVKYVSQPDNTIKEETDWTEKLDDNFSAAIDFSGLKGIRGTKDIPIDIDVNGDGVVDANDTVATSNVWLSLNQLVNTGFSTQCCTCSEPYGIIFTTKDREGEIDHTSYFYRGTARIYIDDLLEKAAKDPNAGGEIAQELVQRILQQEGDYMDHFTRYTKDAQEPGKLVVYDFRDNEPDVAGSQINAKFLLKKTREIQIPAQTNNFTYYEVQEGMMIQAGELKGNAIPIHLYDASAGANGLNLHGKVDLVSNVYSYETTTTTRTENYNITETDTEEVMVSPPYPGGYNKHGEWIPPRPARWQTRIKSQNTYQATRTVTEQKKRLIGVSKEKNASILNNIDRALDKLNDIRTTLGAYYNRLEHAKTVDNNIEDNTQASESRIRDTDMAKEMVGYASHSILEQAGQSMLAQANQSTQGVLALLQ